MNGYLPSETIVEQPEAIALMDIRPMRAGHVLVISRVHAVHTRELNDCQWAAVWRLGRRVAAAQSAIGASGHTWLINDGPASGQQVPHVHLHVIPRHPGDGLAFAFGAVRNAVHGLGWRSSPRALAHHADALRRALADLPDRHGSATQAD